ncbi:UDP-N-acetylglucosamine 2-epimerase, partial [Vibrio sp. 404]|nr:UDP-N-acetylglucosamine 2-epimerase [Vibrio marinisediminis]
SIMNVPCLTLRDNTERPETITLGTNELVGTNPDNIKPYLQKLFAGNWKQTQTIPMWDGQTAKRIIKVLTS